MREALVDAFGSSKKELPRFARAHATEEFTMFNSHRRFILAGAVSVLTVGACGIGAAQSASEKRTALLGFDPVSYFDPGQPERGSKEFTAPFDDALYQFKSAKHRDMFIADPERYAPQYSGYCAVAMGKGSKFVGDPQAWVILNGKLYVVSRGSHADTVAWARANPDRLEAADANWSKLNPKR
jgi:hypothetical protein